MKEPSPDMIVAGKFLLEGQLASGGMGSVWVAKHLDLEIPVAIKFMGAEIASTEEGRMRFEREAKAAAALQSPHVVNVIDYGVDDGLPYIAMELLVGEDLEDRIFRLGRISLDETLHILRQAAKALKRAQDLGIVHRDLKPGNLYLAKVHDDDEEILKILDFGIAKETGPTLLAKGPNTGQIIGSPHYMSPEAVRGARDIDARSDLWSMGVIVFQCVTGRLPFPSENIGDVMGMILADPLPKATEVAPDLPPEIDAFFERALCRDRNQRFQTAREMAEAFAEAIGAPTSGYPASTPMPPMSGSVPPPPMSMRRPLGSVPPASEPPSSGRAVVMSSGEKKSPPPLPGSGERLSADRAAVASAPVVANKAPPPRSRGGILIAVTALCVLLGAGLFLAKTRAPAATGEAAPPPSGEGSAPVPPSAEGPKPGVSVAVPGSSTSVPQATSATPTSEPSTSPSGSAKTGVGKPGPAVKGAATGKPKNGPNWGF